ncbi:glycosyltransferase [Anaerolineales bacterium]
MHIIHITPYYTPAYAFGGVVRACEGMTQALAQQGHQVTVITSDSLNSGQRLQGPLEENIHGVQVLRVPNYAPWLRGKFNLSSPKGLRAQAAKHLDQADIVHVHEYRTLENLLLIPEIRKRHIPIVLSPHGTLNTSTGRSTLKKLWDHFLSPRIAHDITHIVVLAENEAEEVRAVWKNFAPPLVEDQISIIPNGVNMHTFSQIGDGSAFRKRYQIGDSETVVLYMGRLQERKNVDLLIRAFQQADVPNSRLVIAGPDEGMLERLQPLIDARVILTGFLDGEARLEAFAAANLFALAARGEGLSMAMLEAMAAGLPLLISPECNFPQAETEGVGRVLEIDQTAWAQALRQALTDPQWLKEGGKRSQVLIERDYIWDSIALRLESLYLSLL